jgi:exodeoxyribonuclease VII large subunit
MARKVNSQWEFSGELFKAAKPTREVVSVGDFTRRIREVLEGQFGNVWVRGEVSNFRMQTSGHAYFVLKDATASVSCVLFRGQTGVVRGLLRDGASVVIGGQVTVYEPRGQYQLRVTHVEAEGIGVLQAAFEELKRKLAAEGLFASERKRPIPVYPRGLGIVTSATGAALRDVLHVIGRRHAGLDVFLVPARVQGSGASREVAAGLSLLNQYAEQGAPLDVILITRGGGSLEDLWAFNEEVLARAIVESRLPVISAVGHEIDFTISDFAADLRAATPSAAAELVTAGFVECRAWMEEIAVRLPRMMAGRMSVQMDAWEELRRRLARVHPRRRLEDRAQRLDEAQDQLRNGMVRALRDRLRQVRTTGQRLNAARPSARLVRENRRWEDLRRRLVSAMRLKLEQRRVRLEGHAGRLRLLSPKAVLDRGYSITLDAATGRVIRNSADVQVGQRMWTRMGQGRIESVVEGLESDEA